MPFELKSNPLENNALFGTSQEAEQKPNKKQPDTKKKQAKTVTSAETPAPAPVSAPSTPEETEEQFTRATFIVRRDLLVRLKNYAYTERLEIKEVINEILAESLDRIDAKYAKKGMKMLEKYHLD